MSNYSASELRNAIGTIGTPRFEGSVKSRVQTKLDASKEMTTDECYGMTSTVKPIAHKGTQAKRKKVSGGSDVQKAKKVKRDSSTRSSSKAPKVSEKVLKPLKVQGGLRRKLVPSYRHEAVS